MRSVIPNYHHSYDLFFVFFFTILFPPAFSINANTLLSTESLTISSNRTIVSLGDDFELGFFKPSTSLRDSDRWYIGIWYKKIDERTFVWVANRDNPLYNSAGTLKISGINLVLLDQSDNLVWSTNLTGAVRFSVVAELLPNGNFVLRDSRTKLQDGLLWQSFDYPTDTLLPHMKLGLDLKTGLDRLLRPWRNPYDPSSGSILCRIESQGLPELMVWKNEISLFRGGPWDGIGFSGIPEMQKWKEFNIVYNFTENKDEVTYTFRVTTPNAYWRLAMDSEVLRLLTWNPTSSEWVILWISSSGPCDVYGRCNPYGYCEPKTSPCNCIQGFEPMVPEQWTGEGSVFECVRKTQLSCSGDGFYKLSNVKLPDTIRAIADKKIGLMECKERCVRDCNCTAYANTDVRDGGSGCVIWRGVLMDIRKYEDDGQDLYVRLAAVDLVPNKAKNNTGKIRTIVGLSVGAIVLLFLSFVIFFFWWRKDRQTGLITAPTANGQPQRRNLLRNLSGEDTDLELPLIDYDVVAMATNDFSKCNKLGEGGFGPVYKGRLLDGEEIAVKRLSELSSQGTNEFRTEMILIAKLQHRNLVRLLGCYADAEEKMLVYEYLENLSLDYYLFDKTKSSMLNWQKRFDIINGIARGLLYLHQDSRCRVIHRDLKASNILLDKDMIPKISDFGMARIFAKDEKEGTTRRIVGTYGYMSPEYAMDGIYSTKSDVFSFGVLLLEIISGKKNRGFYNEDLDGNLLSYAWRNWSEGKGLNIIDPVIVHTLTPTSLFRPQEILRCIQVGLLCVQDRAEDRPTTSSVVMMLASETEEIPLPQSPGYCPPTSTYDSGSSSSSGSTVNDVTISVLEAR